MKSLPFDRNARRALAQTLIAGAAFIAGVAAPSVAMGLTDIANTPISSSATATVPPNVLFILDASGSMDSDFMPDDANSFSGGVGGKSYLCNTIYYNPAIKYFVPKNADGTDFAPANFFSASEDGFLGGSNSNLSTSFRPNGSSATEPAYYYSWTPTVAGTLPGFTTDCTASDGTSSGGSPASTSVGSANGAWAKVVIPAAEQQNFANWYTYYRTRMLMMKSAAGRAFSGLTDKFRVGFITICPDGSSCSSDTAITTVDANHYLKIDAFTPTHKVDWYKKFYQQVPSSFTPLRQALARAGRHFAGLTDGINSGMSDDPVQYSCQQNFAILTTDGYWNYGRGKTTAMTDMGDTDNNSGLTPRPMLDGGTVSTVVTEEYFRYPTGSCSGSNTKADRYERTVTTDQSGNVTTSGWSRRDRGRCFPNTQITAAAGCSSGSSPSSTTAGCPISTTTNTASSTAGTLADVAEYYYRTDLRAAGVKGALGTDVGTDNNVPPSGSGVEDDKATWQHMTTFTLGLGLDGLLQFDPNYKSPSATGDFPAIRSGAKGWPGPNPGNANSSSSTDQAARIDDLWHAAVNGRGQYFSAKNPTSLALGLQTALTSIQARLSASAAAATSTLEPTAADNLIVLPTYVTSEWSGELLAAQIDVTPGSSTYGQVLPTPVWSAQTKLDAKAQAACDDRRIKLFRAGATDNLVDFTWTTKSCTLGSLVADGLNDSEKAFFLSPSPAPGAVSGDTVDEPSDLSQWGLMTEDGVGPLADQQTAARGANLLNFVRGQRGKEGFAPNDVDKLYRARKHVLGDIVNSQPLYIRAAAFSYSDAGYASFATSVASRTPMVYAPANDGMLHAFYGTTDATGGDEAWAFIPRAVLPRLYKLADNNYANLHEYYVDGKPVRDDVFDPVSLTWKTIVVGGLNKGGRGYYALDVTDPVNPKALWEFTYSPSVCSGPGAFADCNLGYTFGNPVISKLLDGRWVVFVTSGYNNVNPTPLAGDGQGFLYVLEATTGKILYKIGTGVGDPTNPSGLAKITAWVNDSEHNNTTLRVYGTDLLGNVWRFDVNDEKDALGNPVLAPAGREATLLATAKDSLGKPQPIMVAPRLAEVGSPPSPYLFVGTGQYLGLTDVSTTQGQSVYAIRDPLTSTPYADLRASLNEMTLTTVGSDRFVACNKSSPAACKSGDGWFVDLIEPGERVNVNMELQLGVLIVASNVPANTACEPGGFSFLNTFDITSGFSSAGTTARVGYRTAGLTVGLSIVRLPNGKVIVFRQRSDPPCPTCIEQGEVTVPSGTPSGRRSTWREILP